MGFLKAQWRLLTFSLVCLLSIGAMAWAHIAGGEIDDRLKSIEGLLNEVRQDRNNPANLATIEARKASVVSQNEQLSKALQAALAKQVNNAFYETIDATGNRVAPPREILVKGTLPKSARPEAMRFKFDYKEEFEKLKIRLHASDRASPEAVATQAAALESAKQTENPLGQNYPWGPSQKSGSSNPSSDSSNSSMPELLRQSPEARAAETVAREIWMYVDDGAIGRHPVADSNEAPDDVSIWQAQMSLWIQQDIVTALARCNEKRFAELKKEGNERKAWVAHMPIKRLKRLSIRDWLGKGGGSNAAVVFARSFTGVKNDQSVFVVPLRLEMVIEEAALTEVLDSICRVGFYTPINMHYESVPPDYLQEGWIYGNDPVISITLDLEGYYFRKVFDQWIPDSLKKILSTPEAKEEIER